MNLIRMEAEGAGRLETAAADFRAVVMYEDRAAGELARRALDLIAGQLDLPKQELFISLWRLDVARQAHLMRQVNDDLARADLIIIAGSHPAALADAHAAVRRATAGRSAQPSILLLDPAERLLFDGTSGSLPRPRGVSAKDPGESWALRTCA